VFIAHDRGNGFVQWRVCIALAAKITTDYDHSTDFRQYNYSWLNVKAGDPLWPDRIRSAVDFQLVAKGWTLAASRGDASVAAFGATHKEPQLQTFYEGFGGGWHWRGLGYGMATTIGKHCSSTSPPSAKPSS
jgi:hypothetical protein